MPDLLPRSLSLPPTLPSPQRRSPKDRQRPHPLTFHTSQPNLLHHLILNSIPLPSPLAQMRPIDASSYATAATENDLPVPNVAIDDAAGTDLAVLADVDVGKNDGVGFDDAVGGDGGAGVDGCRGVEMHVGSYRRRRILLFLMRR